MWVFFITGNSQTYHRKVIFSIILQYSEFYRIDIRCIFTRLNQKDLRMERNCDTPNGETSNRRAKLFTATTTISTWGKMFPIQTGLNFIKILRAAFFVQKVLCTAFLYWHFVVFFLGKTKLSKKTAFKMLLKLTTLVLSNWPRTESSMPFTMEFRIGSTRRRFWAPTRPCMSQRMENIWLMLSLMTQRYEFLSTNLSDSLGMHHLTLRPILILKFKNLKEGINCLLCFYITHCYVHYYVLTTCRLVFTLIGSADDLIIRITRG